MGPGVGVAVQPYAWRAFQAVLRRTLGDFGLDVLARRIAGACTYGERPCGRGSGSRLFRTGPDDGLDTHAWARLREEP